MDRIIRKKKWTVKKISYITIGIGLLFFLIYVFLFLDHRSRLRVDKSRLTVFTVTQTEFHEFIPNTGIVEAGNTVYLDAVEGGNIKRIVRESGALVHAGDIILELSNLNRELNVLSQEANLNESINRARETRLSIIQNDLTQRLTLAQINNQLAILEPLFRRQKILYEKQLISLQDYEKIKADYQYNLTRKKITYETYRKDSLDRIRRLKAVSLSESKMTTSLDRLSRILDNLTIRAPITGQLSSPHWNVGQDVEPGQRLGQVDVIGVFKVRVPIDELYLAKITEGLPAYTTVDQQEYTLKITYIYPSVTQGRFEVDMVFVDKMPPKIKRGQSLRLRVVLGEPSIQTVLSTGGFYQDTGGSWVYVLEKDDQAIQKKIKLGRKNTQYYEVLEGLSQGDRVIISSYKNFGDSEILLLQ